LEQLADLAVRVGMNVQPGQVVAVASEIEKEELTLGGERIPVLRGGVWQV
jgi:leucyl aminopeptidase (aminopeptidase T)